MEFLELAVRRFKNLTRFHGELSKGFTVFKGPNEAGKSSLIQAIRAILFTDPGNPGDDTKLWRQWRAESLFSLSLKFRHDDRQYRLEKDFEKRSVTLTESPKGRSWRNFQDVSQKLGDMTGLPSEQMFFNTICILQEDLRDFQLSRMDIKNLLWRPAMGPAKGGGLLSRLDREILRLENMLTGGGDAARKVGLRDELNQLRLDMASRRRTLDKKIAARDDLAEINRRIEAAGETLRSKEEALERSRELEEAEGRLQNINNGLKFMEKDLTRVKKAGEEITSMAKKIVRFEEDYALELARLDKSRAYQETHSRRRDLLKVKESFDREINTIKKLMLEREWLSNTLADAVKIGYSEVEEAKNLTASLGMLHESLSNKGIRVEFKRLAGAVKTLRVDGKTIDPAKSPAAEGKDRIRITLPAVGDFEIVNLDANVNSILKKSRDQEKRLAELLKRYDAPNADKLEALYRERMKLEHEAEKKEIELRGYLKGRDFTALVRKQEERERELKSSEKKLKALKKYAMNFEALAAFQAAIYEKKDEIDHLKRLIEGPKRILREFPDEDALYEERDKLLKEVALTERSVEKLSAHCLTAPQKTAFEKERDTLKDDITALRIRKAALEKIIEEKSAAWERLSEKEEQLHELKEKVKKQDGLLQVKRVIRDTLHESEDRLFLSLTEQLDRHMSTYLALMTGGKYDRVKINRDDFSIAVYSKEKEAFLSTGLEQLSSGLNDQIYLAGRLAFIRIAAGDRTLPIILDDPFVHFDSLRREDSLAILKDLSRRHQVLLFTCHDFHDPFADRVIEFSGN